MKELQLFNDLHKKLEGRVRRSTKADILHYTEDYITGKLIEEGILSTKEGYQLMKLLKGKTREALLAIVCPPEPVEEVKLPTKEEVRELEAISALIEQLADEENRYAAMQQLQEDPREVVIDALIERLMDSNPSIALQVKVLLITKPDALVTKKLIDTTHGYYEDRGDAKYNLVDRVSEILPLRMSEEDTALLREGYVGDINPLGITFYQEVSRRVSSENVKALIHQLLKGDSDTTRYFAAESLKKTPCKTVKKALWKAFERGDRITVMQKVLSALAAYEGDDIREKLLEVASTEKYGAILRNQAVRHLASIPGIDVVHTMIGNFKNAWTNDQAAKTLGSMEGLYVTEALVQVLPDVTTPCEAKTISHYAELALNRRKSEEDTAYMIDMLQKHPDTHTKIRLLDILDRREGEQVFDAILGCLQGEVALANAALKSLRTRPEMLKKGARVKLLEAAHVNRKKELE